MKKKMLIAIATLTLIGGIGTIFAQARHCDKDKPPKCEMRKRDCDKKKNCDVGKRCIPCDRNENPCCYLAQKDKLGLSDDQVAQLKKLKYAAKKVKIRNKAEKKILKLEINELLDAEEPDQDAVNEKIDKMAQLKATTIKSCIDASLKARKVLTAEQLQTARSLGKTCPLHKADPSAECTKK